MRATLQSNRFQHAKALAERNGARCMERAANDLRGHLKGGLDGGGLPISTDTGALPASLFVQTEGGSDYDARRADAKGAYMAGGHWTDPVRDVFGPEAYSGAHFDARAAPEEALPQASDSVYAAVATMLVWGWYWQMGHKNLFTRRDEAPRDWFVTPAQMWGLQSMDKHFANLLP